MHEIVEGQRAQLDFLLETETASGRRPRSGLAPADIVCRLKENGSGLWHEKKLDNLSWRDAEHGVHTLTIEPGDFDTTDGLSVLLAGRAGLDPPVVSVLRTFRIAPPRPRFTAADLPCTTVCGRIMTLDHRPRVKAQLNFRVQQPPLAIGGIAVTGEQITVETDEKGYFEVDLVTGANVAVQIQAITYNRILVIPPPPAPGIPRPPVLDLENSHVISSFLASQITVSGTPATSRRARCGRVMDRTAAARAGSVGPSDRRGRSPFTDGAGAIIDTAPESSEP